MLFFRPLASLKYAALTLIVIVAGLVMWSAARDTPLVLAAPLTVTKIADTADGSCNADCSLREAITAANASAGPDAISLPAGSFKFTIAGAGENANATGDLDITGDVTITGAGPTATEVNGASLDRVFDVQNQAHVVLSQLAITGGQTGDGGGGAEAANGELQMTDVLITGNTATKGGGVYSMNAAVAIEDSTIVENIASGYGGGGIYNEIGDITLTRVGLSGNSSPAGRGGGAHNETGVFTVVNSSFVENTAGGYGGGGFYNETGDVSFTNVTFSRNQALSTSGGAVYLEGGNSLFTNVTLAENRASMGGGFSYEGSGSLTIKNSILSAGASGANCADALPASGGHNIDSGSSCHFGSAGDKKNTDPKLAPLAGAGAQTHYPLLPDSPAIDSVPSGSCPPPATDQLDVTRPQGDACDIGAIESSFSVTASPTTSPAPSATPSATPSSPVLVQGDDDCDGDEDSFDALASVLANASLPYDQQPNCVTIGDSIATPALSANLPGLFGDIDCDGDVNPSDALQILRFASGLLVTQNPGCTLIGQPLQ